MLAGCSSTLLSPRHRLRSDASLPFQPCHLQVQEKLHHTSQQKMGTQRLDLPCSFSRKEGSRVAISLEKPLETRSNCSFRQNPITPTSLSSSLVAQPAPWDARREVEGGNWERKPKSLKRFYDGAFAEDVSAVQSKRVKGSPGSSGHQLVSGDDIWFPHIIQEPQPEEEQIFSSLPCSSNAFGKGIGDDREKDVGATGSGGAKQKTRSCSSSTPDTHCSSPNPNEDSSENNTDNVPYPPHHSGSFGAVRGDDDETTSSMEHQGLELVNLLMACFDSIGSGNYAATNFFLARLGELATPLGTSIHRVVAYFTEALMLRVAKLWPHAFYVAPPPKLLVRADDEDDAMAIRILNHVSPIPKFIYFTLNEMLLRTFEGKDRVHIIDFDIKQGLQWPSLFQSLASRPNPPSHVRITGIGDSKQELQDTGIRLAGFAEALNLPFEFHAVVDRFEDVRFWMLHVKEGECVGVNCMMQLHKALYDDSGNILMDFLGLIRSTNPAIVLVAEQEAEHNDPRWETRFISSLPYYSSIFDSIDACLPLDSPSRLKIEEMFAREIRNIISCEGNERIERHEAFSKWRRLMEDRGGFTRIGIREREMIQSRMLLKMFSCDNYSVMMQGEDSAGLTLRWLDQPLYTLSAWAPTDVAGSSTTISQPES